MRYSSRHREGTGVRVQVGDVRLFFDVEGAKLVPDGTVMREQGRPMLPRTLGRRRADVL
jgi:hypothetical protein